MSRGALEYDDFDPRQEALREALCTLGNGYFATRGAAEESEAGEIHYPGTYLAGGFNRLKTEIAGRIIENEDLVNFPNWLCLSFRHAQDSPREEGEWFNPLAVELLHYRQRLDLKRGLLERDIRFRDRHGRETTLTTRRLVHMDNPHLAAIEWRLRPENWSGSIVVRSALDGRVINAGVARYRELASTHLSHLSSEPVGQESIRLNVETCQSRLRVSEAARTRVYQGARLVDACRRALQEQGYIAHELTLDLAQGEGVRIEKVVSLYTSRDSAISEAALAAEEAVLEAGDFEALLSRHVQAWSRLWQRCDVTLKNGERSQMVLRLHIFHLLQTVSPHSIDLDVGVPARGLHGEAYRGHIFWDELFIFPFLNFRIPEITRALLQYRYRRLGAARRLAREAGYRGAVYPWQSGSSGREESQLVHLNPKSGRWVDDNSSLQRHVNAAIAYNVWRYYEVTQDIDFLGFYGAEMLFEIARFWASAVTWNAERGRYDIRGVMGPDEFHDRYPWSDTPGLDNNTYTNLMVAWLLRRALDAHALIGAECRQELGEALALNDAELSQWDAISRQLYVPFHADGIPSQFEGYERLEEFDWEGYKTRYGDIHRLDRLLEAEGDSVNRYKASKQADVLMLFYLFSADELAELFTQLDYAFDLELLPRTIDYYQHRTSNGSTLSGIVSSWVLSRSDRARSLALLEEALESDIADVQGGTTPEGIHLGAMAGTVDLVQRGHAGLEVRDGLLSLNPCLPEPLKQLRLRLRYRGHWLEVEIDGDEMHLHAPEGWCGVEPIMIRGQQHTFGAGHRLRLRFDHDQARWEAF
ncbi:MULTISPECIES: glycoside hydrolase family 65 protein [Halomonadaceae]|uniref:glycoside hydrolase family 65 protein n=1 Tax=Halomonadaceae TaxID=28256 RepID=UPI001598F338|nr:MULTISPECIES: glycosyl hydrolase family 65 protein [Halomonas]QJQ95243.1 glycoside hydrolase family 65 protein [Halomonas sp. PA5]